ncbi:MAG: division/cell wall cluster transcriptional repressor MraZ [Anaerolineales bacterium]|nr:division/cell wall cluster transcriptional repressor MraZ [Anaerolineales bacterium]
MFLGQYRHTIDSKGRLIVPARYRDDLVSGAYVTRGFDRNLMVLRDTSFDLVSERLNSFSLTDDHARKLKRFIFSNADWVELDKTGRIRIPQFLMEFAGLQTDVVIVGVGDYFEVWAPSQWEVQTDALENDDSNAEMFSAFDVSTG